jgi:hypothetical protein
MVRGIRRVIAKTFEMQMLMGKLFFANNFWRVDFVRSPAGRPQSHIRQFQISRIGNVCAAPVPGLMARVDKIGARVNPYFWKNGFRSSGHLGMGRS